MANSKYLVILMEGIDKWNEWRIKHEKLVVDLSEADLNNTNLAGAYLWKVDLHNASLNQANLYEADLTGANLRNASLVETKLINADLRNADMREVNLVKADLSESDLSSANLTGADLYKADLRNAVLAYTIFGDTNLKKVKHTESCIHKFPSIVDQMTLMKSMPLPAKFLRNCGLSDKFIRQVPSLFGPLASDRYYSCFISHSSKDSDFAERLHAGLQRKGVHVWYAPKDLNVADKFRTRIDEAIKVHDKLLIVLSKNSINSPWVEKEVEAAFEKESREKRIVLFPIRLDNKVMETNQAWAADIRRTRHIGDFTGWKNHKTQYAAEFNKLLQALKVKKK